MDTHLPLDPALRVALAWQPGASREALRALFELDAMLAGVVARAREPMLAQMRFAWWREKLEQAPAGRPKGEPLLASISATWQDDGVALISLVDGWEERLGDTPLSGEAIGRFARGRGKAFGAYARIAGAAAHHEAASRAGERWALAQLAREHAGAKIPAAANALPAPLPMPRALRGLCVLDGLAARAITRGEPLLAGRGAALAALRLGLTGR